MTEQATTPAPASDPAPQTVTGNAVPDPEGTRSGHELPVPRAEPPSEIPAGPAPPGPPEPIRPERVRLRLFVLGFQVLFLELVLIRFLAGHIWNLGYFPNFVLLAAFIGFGFGFLLHRHVSDGRSRLLYALKPVFLVAFVLGVIWMKPPGFVGLANVNTTIDNELFFTGTKPEEIGTLGQQMGMFLLWFLGIVLLFFLNGQRMAKLFRLLPPLQAYTLDISGSLAGISLFMLISFLQVPAHYWFLVVALSFWIAIGNDVRNMPRLAASLAPVCLAALSFSIDNPGLTPSQAQSDPRPAEQVAEEGEHTKYMRPHSVWSPYQHLTLRPIPDQGWVINSNNIGHQVFGRPTFPAIYTAAHDLRKLTDSPPFRDVLIIGAGSGSDVAAALQAGSDRIDAVEIDPGIARYGFMHTNHFAAPYKDRKVNTVIDDGRHFIYNTKRRYDLIVFALTDSLVKVSSVSQLRLENYIYTAESFRRASELLNPGGWIVMYNAYRDVWLVEKLSAMLLDAMPNESIVRVIDPSTLGAASGQHLWALIIGASPAGPHEFSELSQLEQASPAATDDWPFPYMKERRVPFHYQVAMAFVIGLVLAALLAFGRSSQRSDPRFAVAFTLLGSAFLLLETKGVIQFSLLFGTTWLNNSLVFFAVLVSVLLGIRVAQAVRGAWLLPTASVLLLASAAVQYAVPLGSLLAFEPLPRFFLAGALMFTPVFMANLIFSVLFRDRADAELYFGWNLLGATAGGVLEYLSLATGYQALGAVVIALYAVALGAAWLGIRNQAKAEDGTSPMPHAGDSPGAAAQLSAAPAETRRELPVRTEPQASRERIRAHE